MSAKEIYGDVLSAKLDVSDLQANDCAVLTSPMIAAVIRGMSASSIGLILKQVESIVLPNYVATDAFQAFSHAIEGIPDASEPALVEILRQLSVKHRSNVFLALATIIVNRFTNTPDVISITNFREMLMSLELPGFDLASSHGRGDWLSVFSHVVNRISGSDSVITLQTILSAVMPQIRRANTFLPFPAPGWLERLAAVELHDGGVVVRKDARKRQFSSFRSISALDASGFNFTRVSLFKETLQCFECGMDSLFYVRSNETDYVHADLLFNGLETVAEARDAVAATVLFYAFQSAPLTGEMTQRDACEMVQHFFEQSDVASKAFAALVMDKVILAKEDASNITATEWHEKVVSVIRQSNGVLDTFAPETTDGGAKYSKAWQSRFDNILKHATLRPISQQLPFGAQLFSKTPLASITIETICGPSDNLVEAPLVAAAAAGNQSDAAIPRTAEKGCCIIV